MCERPGVAKETKTFLLDNGRLKLESVKLAFGLSIVELSLGKWLRLGLTQVLQVCFWVLNSYLYSNWYLRYCTQSFIILSVVVFVWSLMHLLNV